MFFKVLQKIVIFSYFPKIFGQFLQEIVNYLQILRASIHRETILYTSARYIGHRSKLQFRSRHSFVLLDLPPEARY